LDFGVRENRNTRFFETFRDIQTKCLIFLDPKSEYYCKLQIVIKYLKLIWTIKLMNSMITGAG
jgi:hypothetical protein